MNIAEAWVLTLVVCALVVILLWQQRRYWRLFDKWERAEMASLLCHATSPDGRKCVRVQGHDAMHLSEVVRAPNGAGHNYSW